MTEASSGAVAGEALGKATVLGLAAMAVGVLVIANDFTALSVAVPSIEPTFGADLTTTQWVVNGYAGTAFFVDGCFAVAGLLVVVLFVGGTVDRKHVSAAIHRHRAHG